MDILHNTRIPKVDNSAKFLFVRCLLVFLPIMLGTSITGCSGDYCGCEAPPIPLRFTFRSKSEAVTTIQAVRDGKIKITYSTSTGIQAIQISKSTEVNTTVFESVDFSLAFSAHNAKIFSVYVDSVYVGMIRFEGNTFASAQIYFNDAVAQRLSSYVEFTLP